MGNAFCKCQSPWMTVPEVQKIMVFQCSKNKGINVWLRITPRMDSLISLRTHIRSHKFVGEGVKKLCVTWPEESFSYTNVGRFAYDLQSFSSWFQDLPDHCPHHWGTSAVVVFGAQCEWHANEIAHASFSASSYMVDPKNDKWFPPLKKKKRSFEGIVGGQQIMEYIYI